MIENTQDVASIKATTLLAMATGDTDAVIRAQEKAGQAQLVNSDRLPTDLNGNQADFEALGFTFGEPDQRDPMFRPATLPDGWKREGSDHDMWSYVVDQLGRRRVAIFYKAAFYDRRAFVRLNTIEGYVFDCQHKGVDVITDATWATPAAVVDAARDWAERAQESVDLWARRADDHGVDKDAERYIAEYKAERDAYRALATRFEAVTEA